MDALRAGVPIGAACTRAGVGESTFHRWLQNAREGRGGKNLARYREFGELVQKALGDSEAGLVARILTASTKSWQAAAWLLERKWPDRWARRERTELTGPAGGPIQSETRIVLETAIPRPARPELAALPKAVAGGGGGGGNIIELPRNEDT